MNVSKNAYFTTEYLQERIRLPKSRPKTGDFRNSHSPRAGPDELREELTPAQLNYVETQSSRSPRSSVSYHDYYSFRQPNARSRADPSRKSRFLGFHTKSRPDGDKKQCTPKSRDVYDSEDRSSPIDVVFEDPAKREDPRKFSQRLRAVQRKISGNEYETYDYFEELRREPAAEPQDARPKEEIVTQDTNSDAEEWPPVASPKPWKRLKAPRPQKQKQRQVVRAEPASRPLGPQQDFHPLWNYMLSWLVYEQSQAPKITELADADAREPARRSKRAGSLVSGCRVMLQNWSQPVLQRADKAAMQRVQRAPAGSDDELPSVYDIDPYEEPWPAAAEAQPRAMQLQLESPTHLMSNINGLIKNIKIMRIIFAPIDVVAEHFPSTQTLVILVELVIFMWMLYELSLLIDALCMAVKAVCAPMIAVGRFMNRIV